MEHHEFIKEKAESLRGNWRKFESFAWRTKDDLDDPDEWCIVYTHNRDSSILDASNAKAIEKKLESFEEDLRPEVHNHWAVGWVEGFAIRCMRDGEPTEAFIAWYNLIEELEDSRILDPDDYASSRKDCAIRSIGLEFYRRKDELPEDWEEQVYNHLLSSYEEEEVFGSIYEDPWVDEKLGLQALKELGFLDEE